MRERRITQSLADKLKNFPKEITEKIVVIGTRSTINAISLVSENDNI